MGTMCTYRGCTLCSVHAVLLYDSAMIVTPSQQVLKCSCCSGAVLLSCEVDMVTMRAASGDGVSMHAQSAADLVLQLSLQVSFSPDTAAASGIQPTQSTLGHGRALFQLIMLAIAIWLHQNMALLAQA